MTLVDNGIDPSAVLQAASESIIVTTSDLDQPATAWEGPRGGHHVSGVLRFADARKILASNPKHLELQIDGVAGATRTFRWNLQEPR